LSDHSDRIGRCEFYGRLLAGEGRRDNGTKRGIRSLAAARSDGGPHRADWSAAAFARLKGAIVTGMKNQVRFIQYGIEVVRAQLRGERLPLPLAATPDTS
jgi:hypothetical protein